MQVIGSQTCISFIRFIYLYFKCYPLSWFPLQNPTIPSSSSCLPTHSLPLPCTGIALHWGIDPSQDLGPLLPLMCNKAILCCICSWSHGSLYVEVLGVLVGSYCCSSYGVAKPFNPFSSFSTGDPVLSPMTGCKHPSLCRHWQNLSGDSCIRLLSASTCWHPQ